MAIGAHYTHVEVILHRRCTIIAVIRWSCFVTLMTLAAPALAQEVTVSAEAPIDSQAAGGTVPKIPVGCRVQATALENEISVLLELWGDTLVMAAWTIIQAKYGWRSTA